MRVHKIKITIDAWAKEEYGLSIASRISEELSRDDGISSFDIDYCEVVESTSNMRINRDESLV